ncbi:MAG: type II toxin-antitoxin system RelE/ParE family toxin [Epsilonproteobacteria bacterium]|nr:type II toxin-antitoxin system RelE/ParE family toxin [Campylobacterota bacterium]
MRIDFSPKAQLRLEMIAQYIYEQTKSKKLTRKYLQRLREFIVSTLSAFPYAGRSCEELISGSRKLVYQGYSIIYTLEKDQIWVLTLYRENLP